ncbi:MAG: hypothetical protein B6U77_03430 [Candidatus Hecatellales archaeon ex4484_218]|nr:MAG: hypothetical protein B6U77_03430 [Candidatus Hecatellales archaeon ex4484_218]
MKVTAECIPCLLERGYREAARVVKDEAKLKEIMGEVLKTISQNFSPEVAPAYLGTLRDRVIKRMVGKDPYKELKKTANDLALKLLPQTKKTIFERSKNPYECFREACKIAVVANSMEFDVSGYDFRLEDLEKTLKNMSLAVDDLFKAYRLLEKSKNVLILTDNAGEIVFDGLLAETLKFIGVNVTVAVKSGPVLNDATLEDALKVGIDKIVDKLTTIGSDCVGLIWEEASEEIKKIFLGSGLVVAKGMGNYEALTELENLGVNVLFLLKAKCNPVAKSIGVSKGSNVALLKKL